VFVSFSGDYKEAAESADKVIAQCCVLQSLTEDVARQMERERELQKRFADLQQQKDDFSELLNQ